MDSKVIVSAEEVYPISLTARITRGSPKDIRESEQHIQNAVNVNATTAHCCGFCRY